MAQADIDRVYGLHMKFVDAMASGDADFLMSCYTEDAVTMPPGQGPAKGLDAIRAFLEGSFDAATTDSLVSRNEDYLELGDDVIVEIGEGTWAMTPTGGESISNEIKWLAVWHKQSNGDWKIVRNIFNTSD